ncbi:hypothetical protein [Leptospira congkakensis]|nr:hypothetical protein [Leptospira congkakensis]
MLKKMRSFGFVLVFVFGCANVYSPMGIRGEEAKKQLEELRSNLGIVGIFASLSAVMNASANSSNTSYTCATDNSAVLGFTTPTTTANFNLPSQTNYIDLSVTTNGTFYFRSNQATTTTMLSGKILKTASTSASASCSSATSSVCGATDLSGVSFFSSISSIMTVAPGSCFAIRCTTPAYVRLKLYNIDSSGLPGVDTLISGIYTPYIFESIANIGEETYYTKKSFERCKREIVNYSMIEIQFANLTSSLVNDASICNKPYSSIQGALLNPGLTAAIQADACDLEPVNPVGF